MVATALEPLGLSMAGLAHKARTADDSAGLYRVGMWTVVLIAAGVNYRHGSTGWAQPSLNGVVFAALYLGSVTGWELRERQAHRQRHAGRLPPQRPRFGVARWLRYPRISIRATSFAIRDNLTDPHVAWTTALTEVRRAREFRRNRRIFRRRTRKLLQHQSHFRRSAAPPEPECPPLIEPLLPGPDGDGRPSQPTQGVDVSDLLPVAREVAAELGPRLSRDRLLDGIRARGHTVGGRRRAAIYDVVRASVLSAGSPDRVANSLPLPGASMRLSP
ncbi:hypothetical protein YIM_21735 [Amycolatopsis sp. YIM 10]|nr:hypothetical protein YIM_21735 [Amycolatopsis sp. YIM 10]